MLRKCFSKQKLLSSLQQNNVINKFKINPLNIDYNIQEKRYLSSNNTINNNNNNSKPIKKKVEHSQPNSYFDFVEQWSRVSFYRVGYGMTALAATISGVYGVSQEAIIVDLLVIGYWVLGIIVVVIVVIYVN